MQTKCENCAGKLIFSPEDKAVKCEHCGITKGVPYVTSFSKKDFVDVIDIEQEQTNELKKIKCKSCGAEIVLGARDIQATCPYCGDSSMSQARKAKIVSVDSIIPFSFGKTKALQMFKKEIAGHFFTNKKLFNNVKKEDVKGMYVNSFVFDYDTSSIYKGVFSYSKSYTDSDGHFKTKTVDVNVSGTHNLKIENITIEANSKLNQADFAYIQGYKYQEAVKFHEDFLNGYMIEYQDANFETYAKKAQDIAVSRIKNSLLDRYNCTKIETLNLHTNYLSKKCNYCLLPVYFINTIDPKTNEKIQVLMNGQTGKVGKTPKNMSRILLIVFLFLAIVLGVIGASLFFIFFVV